MDPVTDRPVKKQKLLPEQPHPDPNERKIIFLDTETGGFDAIKNPLLEIALKVVDAFTGRELGQYESTVKITDSEWKRCEPGALKVNGITYSQAMEGKEKSVIRQDIIDLFQSLKINRKNACYVCQNPSFDRSFFTQLFSEDEQQQQKWPYHWLDLSSMNWAITMRGLQVIGLKPENVKEFEIPFSKDRIAKQHGLPSEERPHKAMNGVDHLMMIYENIIGYLKG